MKTIAFLFRAVRNSVIWRAVAGWFCSSCRVSIAALCCLASCAAAAKGIPASQVMRHGLTNEQIDYIMERHPSIELKISRRDWQGMRFELMRFHNLTNWVDTFTDRQGFADALATAQEGVKELTTKSAALQKAVDDARKIAEEWRAKSDTFEAAAQKFENESAEARQKIEALALDVLDREKRAEAAEARAERLKAYLEDKAANGTALQKPVYKALLTWYNSLTD